MQNVNQLNKQNQDLQTRKSSKNADFEGLDELAPKVSIQDAFKKFQKEKFYQLKLNKYLKNVQVDRKNPQFKQQLREKFIETAKKYIGIPYAQKYHQPGDPLYGAPLYLDCCALVRQAVFDLRQEFGYTLAKWNQSYQFDLLPDEGLKEQDLKPGDLIFYSATYRNEKLKPFPHKMVHVQIYMGEGKSIGARWQKGTIQIFDSYKFQSTLYYDIEFHYRSIDKWLQGTFESHCKQHKWLDERNNQWLSDKFSVFADPSLDDMEITKNQAKDIRKVLVGKGNNSKLVSNYFLKNERDSQYSLMSDKQQFSPHFYFKWVQSTGQVDFYSFKEGEQLVNHIPNICVISSKLELLKTLRDFELDAESKGYPLTMNVDDFIPKTYRLDVMSDQISFLNDDNEGIWIYKPRNLNQGRGIKLIADIKQFKKEFIQSKKFYLGEFSLNNMLHYKPDILEKAQEEQESERYKDLKHDGLIQHYIRPLLLHGRKFDIRCYLFVNSQPSLALFHPGYLRLTIDKYDEEDIENEQKLMIHLTNNCYQHKHKDYKQKKQESIGTWDLIKEQIGLQKMKILQHEIKRILFFTFSAAKRKLMSKKGTYQLLGCDFIVDENYKPYLLEVNTNPAMFTDTQVQKQIIPPLAENTLDIALGLFENGDFVEKIQTDPYKFGFEIIYSANSNKIYNGQEEIKLMKDFKSINGIEYVQGEKQN